MPQVPCRGPYFTFTPAQSQEHIGYRGGKARAQELPPTVDGWSPRYGAVEAGNGLARGRNYNRVVQTWSTAQSGQSELSLSRNVSGQEGQRTGVVPTQGEQVAVWLQWGPGAGAPGPAVVGGGPWRSWLAQLCSALLTAGGPSQVGS